MSQHPSLRSSEKDKKHRSVLKRYERVRSLKDKEKWEEKDSVFGLPKVKIVKFKIKKEKAVAAEAATDGAEGAGAAEAMPSQSATQAKPASQAKGAPAKEASKPQGGAKKEAK